MALGTTMAALLPAIISTVAGGAAAGVDMLGENKKAKQAKEMELLHTTKDGFDGMGTFGSDMMSQPPKMTLGNPQMRQKFQLTR